MDDRVHCRSTVENEGLIVQSDWGSGPRTPAWDSLWRAIFDDVRCDLVDAPAEQLPPDSDAHLLMDS